MTGRISPETNAAWLARSRTYGPQVPQSDSVAVIYAAIDDAYRARRGLAPA